MASSKQDQSLPIQKPGTLSPDDQTSFDIEFLDRVLEQNANHVDALRHQVELLAGTGNYARALELDQRLVNLRPYDRVAQYNLACSYSMLGQIEPAIKALERAILLGYDDVAHLEICLLYTSPSPRDQRGSRMPSSA